MTNETDISLEKYNELLNVLGEHKHLFMKVGLLNGFVCHHDFLNVDPNYKTFLETRYPNWVKQGEAVQMIMDLVLMIKHESIVLTDKIDAILAGTGVLNQENTPSADSAIESTIEEVAQENLEASNMEVPLDVEPAGD